ncbi:NAD-dependent epimerase/dehydratase family protein [Pseudomonas sp.]|uniref:NAD-dependent epimerase/dehydratase family protein n=1 Tax=Pseudomonas sp. TaxID=306 RepID=UPI003A96D6A5
MSNRQVLITGASGFVGSRLVSYLSSNTDLNVIEVVRSKGGSQDNNRVIVCEDLCSGFDWPCYDIDTVIHLAGKAHAMNEQSSFDLDVFRAINTDATLMLAKQAAAAGVRRFIFLSSIGVYGTSSGQPISSLTDPHPVEPYAISKFEAELLLRDLSISTGMEVVVIRPPLVYGPNAPGNFSRLKKLCCMGFPLPFGRVSNRRTFIGIDNLCSLIEVCITHQNATLAPILPGDVEVVSTVDFMRHIAKAANVNLKLAPFPICLLKLLFLFAGKRNMYGKIFDDLEINTQETYDLLNWVPPKSLEVGVYDAVVSSES